MIKKLILHNLAETEKLGQTIGLCAQPNDILILNGDLGAGKTTLTKSIAHALKIIKTVKSPTYTIVREYHSGKIPLFHIDLYRVGSDVDELALMDYFEAGGLTVIEWGNNLLPEDFPESYLEIILTSLNNENIRAAEINAYGNASSFLERINKSL